MVQTVQTPYKKWCKYKPKTAWGNKKNYYKTFKPIPTTTAKQENLDYEQIIINLWNGNRVCAKVTQDSLKIENAKT